jgi:chromate transporter
VSSPARQHAALIEVFLVFLRLGLTSFGGPVAHLGYFRNEFVARRRWLDEPSYADLLALCQFLPGPASSQVGMAIGLTRAGIPGAIVAWAGFTLPSAALLVAFAYGVQASWGVLDAAVLHGLKIVAAAVVAQAVWAMARSLCPDAPRATLAVAAAVVMLLAHSASAQLAVIGVAAVAGRMLLRIENATGVESLPMVPSTRTAVTALVLFASTLALLPLVAKSTGSAPLALFDSFYRTGSLVFGGGHVVLPLLQAEVVPPGWVSNEAFLAGYGAAQAVPGPLFTFAAYLGAVMRFGPGGWAGGLLGLLAVFLPSFFLVIGALPFWHRWRASSAMRSALAGVNAAVVGLLLAALYDPIWVSAIRSAEDLALALAAFLLLAVWRVSPWMVVVGIAAIAGGLL